MGVRRDVRNKEWAWLTAQWSSITRAACIDVSVASECNRTDDVCHNSGLNEFVNDVLLPLDLLASSPSSPTR